MSGGKPRHVPTQQSRDTVMAMTSYGITQEEICAVLGGIDIKTLHKYYRSEIDTATAKANAQVAQRLFKKCMADDTTAMIFWLKTRGQWKETIVNKNENTNRTITFAEGDFGKDAD